MNSPGKVTYQQIRDLLATLGFVGTAQDGGSIIFHHSQTGSLILLPASRGGRLAREADILSVGQHLVGRGHLGEHDFDAFVSRRILPESAHA